MTVRDQIMVALEDAFEPSLLSVENESHRHNVPADSETHFKVVLVAERFTGERSVKRHQLVYGVLAAFLAGSVHALALHTYTPQEWSETEAAPDSPDCRGGTGK
jgi:BolA protein